MRSASPRPVGRNVRLRAVTALLAVTVSGGLAGCDSIGDAQQVIDRAHLVNDLASRLDHATELTYTAEYQLPGGQHATITQAQQPLRTAYSYPGGTFVTTPNATIDCRTDGGATTCTLTGPPSPSTEATTALLRALHDHGLMPPTMVVGLLTAASMSPDAVIRQQDTTLAGEHATCTSVTGVENAAATEFDACITSAGVLGSFKGVVDGKATDVSLIRYATTVTATAFDPPAGATIVDNRPKAS
ncbi:hypothetical protein ACNTMW_09280 [Planosporangium sp. 12N6]|uniref:hypothetical protein n=1 Tax=Planosporangium spinosum TaxID=3402278 RepID=UPI003CF8F212